MNQLVLPLRLADHAVFDSFVAAGNATLVATLVATAEGRQQPGCWVWGGPATGKTHLLQATVARAGDRSVYVPLELLGDGKPDVLDGLARRELVCLDDIDAVSGRRNWEAALFDLGNQLLDTGHRLVVSAATPPREASIELPDLESRLSRLPVFRIRPLGEHDRVAALQLRARHRGLDLPDETARFLLNRSRRDMASLYELLDKLDLEALRTQRKLTIPFVKEVLRL